MITATTVEFFQNLSQHTYNDRYYDFHNEYDCLNIEFMDNLLILVFKNIHHEKSVFFKFGGVEIVKFSMWANIEDDSMTIDNIYRGRTISNGQLKEISDNGKAYFYLEFYEGQAIEFWAAFITVEEDETTS